MTRSIVVESPHETLTHFHDRAVMEQTFKQLPVVAKGGTYLGTAATKSLRLIYREKWATTPITASMDNRARTVHSYHAMTIVEQVMAYGARDYIPVVDPATECLIGIPSTKDVLRARVHASKLMQAHQNNTTLVLVDGVHIADLFLEEVEGSIDKHKHVVEYIRGKDGKTEIEVDFVDGDQLDVGSPSPTGRSTLLHLPPVEGFKRAFARSFTSYRRADVCGDLPLVAGIPSEPGLRNLRRPSLQQTESNRGGSLSKPIWNCHRNVIYRTKHYGLPQTGGK